ncbi:DUF4367 domain-containing protein [Paenibacillus sp. 2KB_20]|uniref:DUF4367 domain-containing protein n=1 Tax=Paenibacillus sp. 2KB_20 TaxID=3232977 RepID=UPI003F9504AD
MIMIFADYSVDCAAPKITELESKQTPFKIQPKFPDIPKEWKWHQKSFENSVVLIYLNPKGDYIMSISQENKKPIHSTTSTKTTIVKNTTYYYDAWISRDAGWMIRWIRGEVYYEMNSDQLTVREMIRIAETIK